MVRKRLFLGGLYHEVDAASLSDRFAAYGQISNVDIKTKTDSEGLPFKTFAYVDIEVASEDEVKKCVSTYSGSKWKGFTLSIQEARPSFMQRLQEEREKANAQNKINATAAAKPAPAVPARTNRPLVIRNDNRKGGGGGVDVVKVNPKTSNKSVRRVGLGDGEDKGVAGLTWTIEEKKKEVVTLRKKETIVEENGKMKKKKKLTSIATGGDDGGEFVVKKASVEKKKKKGKTSSESANGADSSIGGGLFDGLSFSEEGNVVTSGSKSTSTLLNGEVGAQKTKKEKRKRRSEVSIDDAGGENDSDHRVVKNDDETGENEANRGESSAKEDVHDVLVDESKDSDFLLAVKSSVAAEENDDGDAMSDCSADTDEIISRAKKRKLGATTDSSASTSTTLLGHVPAKRAKSDEEDDGGLFDGISFGVDGKVARSKVGGSENIKSVVAKDEEEEEEDNDDDKEEERVHEVSDDVSADEEEEEEKEQDKIEESVQADSDDDDDVDNDGINSDDEDGDSNDDNDDANESGMADETLSTSFELRGFPFKMSSSMTEEEDDDDNEIDDGSEEEDDGDSKDDNTDDDDTGDDESNEDATETSDNANDSIDGHAITLSNGTKLDLSSSDSDDEEKLTEKQKRKRAKRTVLPSFGGIKSLTPDADAAKQEETPTGFLALALQFSDKPVVNETGMRTTESTATSSDAAELTATPSATPSAADTTVTSSAVAESIANSSTDSAVALSAAVAAEPTATLSATLSAAAEPTATSGAAAETTVTSSAAAESTSAPNTSEPSAETKKPKKSKKDKEKAASSSDQSQQRNMTALEKRKLADQKRLEALAETKERNQKRADLLQSALRGVDKFDGNAPKLNKKITFDSDDEGEKEEEVIKVASGKEIAQTQSTSTNDNLLATSSSNAIHEKVTSQKFGMALFEDDDDDDDNSENDNDEEELNKAFEFKPHFEGDAGQKLMALQAKFKNDSRFKLDERFLEAKEGEKSGEEEEEDQDVADLKAEKAKALDILNQVLGGDPNLLRSKEEEKKKKKKLLGAHEMNAMRYDPDAAEADALVIKEDTKSAEEKGKEKQSKKKKKDENMEGDQVEAEAEEEERKKNLPPEVSAKRFYDVDTGSLTTLFKNKEKTPTPASAAAATPANSVATATDENEDMEVDAEASSQHSQHSQPHTFSFGFALDDKSKSIADENTKDVSAQMEDIKTANISRPQAINAFSFSSDEEDDDDGRLGGDNDADAIDDADSRAAPNSFFVLSLLDCRLTEGKEFFRSADATDDSIREEWMKERSTLVEAYKMKHRHAARRRRKGKK